MKLKVHQLANNFDLTTRTIHYYDEIGLLKPHFVNENGYREYGEKEVIRLQKILFFQEIGFTLQEIKNILDNTELDTIQILNALKDITQKKLEGIDTVLSSDQKDNTMYTEYNYELKTLKEMYRRRFESGYFLKTN